MTWTPKVYRDVWADDLRLLINGRDVTYFRGRATQIGSYQLQEPFAFGPADFTFPQITTFEVSSFGRGSLRWLSLGARAELVPVRDGSYDDRVWAGVVTSLSANGSGIGVHCDGQLSGRLSVQDKQPPVFSFKKDLGLQCYDTVLQAGISMQPFLGPKTGIRTFTTGGGSDQLSFLNDLLAQAITDDGDQWTIARRSTGRGYVMRLKDTTTVHATVFLGAHGVELDVTRDMTEEPNRLWGTGTDPNGQKITNAVIPNLFKGEAAQYPFNDGRSFGVGTTNEDTDTGAGISALQRKLTGMGLATRAALREHYYEEDTRRAVKSLQRRAGLDVTGVVNPATWRALFNITTTGRTLYQARVLPMAQLSSTRRFNLTSNGSVDVANPHYDAHVVPVDRTIDFGGGVWKEEMLDYSENLLDTIHKEPNWVGTLSLAADLFKGDVNAGTANPVPMGRLDLREGHNVKVVGFNGSTLFHVSGINVDGGARTISCAVDTRARDLLTVGQIIQRNKESRRSPGRQFITSIRRPNAMDSLVVSNELFGLVDDWTLTGNRWNRLMVPCGQAGSIDRIRLHLRDDKAEFVMGVSVRSIAPGRMNAIAGSNPLDKDSKWKKGHTQHRLKSQYLFLYSAGQAAQPLGYYPRAKVGDDNKATGAPITGDWEDDAGFAFRTFRDDRVSGVLYVYVFPDRDTVLQGGKVFYVNIAEGS